ncbi:class I SAM-dependent methyltransferase [Nocardioides sp. KIGAM211]|uniref:Class I SAM-dependent methyltransferase n=2 Tax=Nocardioides luti TaxID=2761101 RepID=A0A7X0RDG3_9ACTN|nr:class I SAM-dependent methyltransferase [Nocardioides luti]MBB6626287.1 class I SAM-dependent methyltransferase [Nocardioides luti]
MTRDQAAVLHAAAGAVPAGGAVVEIGSHHGRSAVVLAAGLREGARLVAVDPFPDDWRYGAAGTEQRCRANLARAGVADRVDLRVATSADVRARWDGRLDLVYVDGKHDHWTARADLGWADHVTPGGWVLVHDAFSSLGVTTALLRVLATSRTLRYVGRTGSLARLQVAPPSTADRLRLLGELPWWARNLVVKVLLRLRLRPLARALGHGDAADPY